MNTLLMRSRMLLRRIFPFIGVMISFYFTSQATTAVYNGSSPNGSSTPLQYLMSFTEQLAPATSGMPIAPSMMMATASNTGPYCSGATIQLQSGPNAQLAYAWSGPLGYTNVPITQAVTQAFSILINTGVGTWTDNSTVPGWYSQRTGTGTSIEANAGSSTTGNLYSYGTGSASERALGTIGSGGAAAGNFAHGYRYQNTTGQAVTKILVSYTLEQWRNSAADVQVVSFYYKISATPITALDPNNNGTWTLVPALSLGSPITAGTAGALDGNDPANRVTVANIPIGNIVVPNGQYIMLKWDDPDHAGIDHGLSIDDVSISFTTQGVQNPTRPNSTILMAGVYTVTVTDNAGNTSTASTTVVVNPSPVPIAGTYGPVCATAANITLSGTPAGGTWSGPGLVPPNQFDPSANTQTLTYSVTSGGCTGSSQTTITVNPCLTAPEMRFVLLNDNGEVHGSCVSQSDCDLNKICFGLQYTPNRTGTLTSYTTGFVLPCVNGGNPVLSNNSCVMTNNSFAQNACAQISMIQWNFNGNSGSTPVVTGVPIIIHQVCFLIPNSGSIALDPFPPPPEDNLTTSIDVSMGGGAQSEVPFYVPFSFDSSLYCGILPVKYLHFKAQKDGELASRLDWTTADEINNAYFEVQRANDNQLNFVTIGRVDATKVPAALNVYDFKDPTAKPGYNYYRLKQFDLDGKFAFSPIRSVLFTTEAFAAKVWPNPVADLLNVYLTHANTDGHFELVDLAGRTVYTGQFKAGDSSHEIPVDTITPGIYTLVVESGTERIIDKIIIME